jgi:hypothetical protein
VHTYLWNTQNETVCTENMGKEWGSNTENTRNARSVIYLGKFKTKIANILGG